MKIIFLGTSGSMPTKERVSSAIAVKLWGELILLDCGEGTQQRMVAGHIGFRRPMIILISHLHGDHILGLPGLLQTMSLLRRERELHIYGPTGLTEFLDCIFKSLGPPVFPVMIHEINESKVIFSGQRFQIKTIGADHDLEAWSFGIIENPRPGRFHPEKARELGIPEGRLWKQLQSGQNVKLENQKIVKSEEVVDPPRKGRKIVYSGDTRPNESLVNLAKDADILIHEATFDESLEDRALNDGHSTAKQAAQIAKRASVKRLILTHISSRYPYTELMLEEATQIYPGTIIAKDLLQLEVPFLD